VLTETEEKQFAVMKTAFESENARPVAAWCDDTYLHVRLADDRQISTPLWWSPRLLSATPEQRSNVELMLGGVHWPDMDEDRSVKGMLLGWKVPRAKRPEIPGQENA
jgi:Protein of unknown function (DUF2442)